MGDQITCKIVFSQEANEECETYMYRNDNFINAAGDLIRVISKEAYQTFYAITKMNDDAKEIPKEEFIEFCKMDPKEITLDKFIDIFGDTKDISLDGKSAKRRVSKYNPYDIITLTKAEYPYVKGSVKTTLGRLIFYKIMVERNGFTDIVPYINETLIAKKYKAFEAILTNALKDGKITTNQMIRHIDTRDWFGLEMHGVITTSFSQEIIKMPPEVKKLKKKLLEENKEEIAKGNPQVVDKIAKQLIEKEMEVMNGNYGLDVFTSGARGSVDNHLKNILLMRGATYNSATNSYDIIENSLFEGLEKKDIPTHANTLTQGSVPKSVEFLVLGKMCIADLKPRELLKLFHKTISSEDS